MSRHDLEDRFRKAFVTNASEMMKGLFFIEEEYRLYPATDILQRDFYGFDENYKRLLNTRQIGRIDLLFRYKSTLYAGEIKYQPYQGGDFWDALKIIGYTRYLKFQAPQLGNVKPAIFMPQDRIKLEHQILAGQLEILLLGITNKDENFTVAVANK